MSKMNIDDLAGMIKSLNVDLNTKFDALQQNNQNTNAKIDTLSESVKIRLLEIDAKVDNVEAANRNLTSQLYDARKTITKQTNDIEEHERKMLLTDGVFYGVPFVHDENINEIFLKICRKIDFEMDQYNVVSIRRQRNPKNNLTCPIFVKFLSQAVRNHFFECYISKRNLSLLDLGFTTNRRVFFYESITKTAQSIFRKALDYKLNGQLGRVHTYNGFVFVRSIDSNESRRVTSITELDVLITPSSKRRLSDQSTLQPSIEQADPAPKIIKKSLPSKSTPSTLPVLEHNPTTIRTASTPLLPNQSCRSQSPLIPQSNLFARTTRSKTESSTLPQLHQVPLGVDKPSSDLNSRIIGKK